MSLDSVIYFFQALTYFIAPITLSFIALNFWRKNGVRVQGEISSIQSSGFEDYYHGVILLENLKDRPLNILNIYIMVGNAYYIEVGSYDDEPLVLKPYEVKRVELKPVYAYLINMGYPDYLVGMRERKVADKLNPQRISWLMARSVRSLAREQILHQTGDAQDQQQ